MDLARRALLTGQRDNSTSPLRPPWSGNEQQFIQDCTRCGECLKACPEKVLISGSGGFPELDVSNGECTFCQACVQACQPGALVIVEGHPPWHYTAEIGDSCLMTNGVHCRSCEDPCETRAIRFPLMSGVLPKPQLNEQACNGCGACISACPVNAISLISKPSPQPE